MRYLPLEKMRKRQRSPEQGLFAFYGGVMCNDTVTQTLCDYLAETDDRLWEMLCYSSFDEVTIARWTAGELIQRIADHPNTPAEDSIESFALKMMAFRTAAEGRPTERIFSIASECALEWLELFKNGGKQ